MKPTFPQLLTVAHPINLATFLVLGALLLGGTGAKADWNPDDPNKWLQLPDETLNGIDVEMLAPYQLADDFLCTNTAAITDLHLWLSWRGDEKPPDELVQFEISIWSDQPAVDPEPFSHPLELLWRTNLAFPNFTSRVWTSVQPGEGWMTPPAEWLPLADTNIWQYNFFFDRTNAFVQEGTPENPIVYWVSVSVNVPEFGYFIGWKTSTNHWNDDAVWRAEFDPAWHELRYPPGHPYAGESIDLAFVITSEAMDFGDAPDQPYPTLLVSNGARHIPTGPWLGPAGDNPDDEPDGQPNGTATGDDKDIAAPANPPPNYDDENGVIVPPLVPGMTANLQIIVSDPSGGMPFVDGWVDFNRNGVWEASEQVIAGPLSIGTNIVPVLVPAGIGLTNTYARFRISTAGGLSPTGLSVDGEVEDYEVYIQEEEELLDYGDAPDGPYPTLLANNGARHVPTGPWLGPAGDNPDDEPDGQPNNGATGDDLDIAAPINPLPNYDDENGVIIPVLMSGTTGAVQIIVSDPGGVGGVVDGWIDFNCNGVWEASEQIVAASFPVGTNFFNVSVPTGISNNTNTYARFRISSVGGLQPTGLAQDGEVEDYQVQILKEEVELLDFGDAPDSPVTPGYPTLLVNNGARHLIMAGGPWLGGAADNPDDEPDGQPNAAATGDDLDISAGNPPPNYDDENGVTFLTPIVPGFNATVQVITTGLGILNGWVDFGADGSWIQPSDYILPNLPLGTGTNILYFTVPAGATVTNSTYARFRYTRMPLVPGQPNFDGLAPDGEVEDYMVAIENGPDPLPDFDFGDAPDVSYSTLLPNGPRHVAYPSFCLGTAIDTEPDGQPDPLAQGDDSAGVPDDEDGVIFTTPLRRGSNACVDVVLTSTLSFGRLDAWVDFNNSGIWGDMAGEQIFSALNILPGTNSGLCFPVPAGSQLGHTYARFRLTSLGGLSPYYLAPNGEVEDYRVHICQGPPSTNVVFTGITVTNAGSQQVVALTWNAETNLLYQVQQATTLSNMPPSWSNVGMVLGPTNSIVFTNSTLLESYYRIMLPDVCP